MSALEEQRMRVIETYYIFCQTGDIQDARMLVQEISELDKLLEEEDEKE